MITQSTRYLIHQAACAALTVVLALTATDPARAQTTERVSVSSTGEQGNDNSRQRSATPMSADGRVVAFLSFATNLVPGDTNGVRDVFVRDRLTGETTRVSVSSSGEQANQKSGSLRPNGVTRDGRFVAFYSEATNLVPADTNDATDVFVHDRRTGETTRVSVSSTGEQGNSLSISGNISADGRFVAFTSDADNLVPNDTNGAWDVFVHDRGTGHTTRVSVSSAGEQANEFSFRSFISASGRFVTFSSESTNLVAGDTNDRKDIFVHDRDADEDGIFDEPGAISTTRVSVSSTGEQANHWSFNSGISADGRFVAFGSKASNLVAGDTNGQYDVFVHDRQTAETTRVSVSSAGTQGNAHSGLASPPTLSADGRFVAFESYASNLVAGDTNDKHDVFVHDRMTGETTRASLSATGEQAAGRSSWPSLSANGRFVGFVSEAANLVPGDTNGFWDNFVRDRGGACDPCDTNCDGSVDLTDVEPFIDLIIGRTEPCDTCAGDANNDGSVDLTDVEAFIACLLG